MNEALEVRDLVVDHGRYRAVCGISLHVEPRRTLAIVGPSGAGKSTVLRSIAGLTRATSGSVVLGARAVQDEPPQRRRIALVFQDDALFRHLSVRGNLLFAVRQRSDAKQRIEELARAFHLGGYLDRRPSELSGGERQRVSIARALLSEPDALLLDEPLAHLDPELRLRVRDEVLGLRERFSGPIVYVTHDHAEAMSVGDELALLIDGSIEDIGAPQRVYDRPRTVRAARVLGERSMNLLDGSMLTLGDVLVGIRPERVQLVDDGGLRGRVVRCEPTGADMYLHVETVAGIVLVRTLAQPRAVGDNIGLHFPQAWIVRFNRANGEALA